MFRYTLVPSARNVSDRALDKLRINNGVIMISLIPGLTNPNADAADLDDVVDHINYVAERIGFDHVGIGSDYDGMVKAVRGAEDISKLPCLVEKMLDRGISEPDVKKVIGLNIIRVLKDVEKVARNLRGREPVLEDEVKQLWNNDFRAFVRSQYPNAERDNRES
jgi:membrane dipeptidase